MEEDDEEDDEKEWTCYMDHFRCLQGVCLNVCVN